jgi:hypothetical protein
MQCGDYGYRVLCQSSSEPPSSSCRSRPANADTHRRRLGIEHAVGRAQTTGPPCGPYPENGLFDHVRKTPAIVPGFTHVPL